MGRWVVCSNCNAEFSELWAVGAGKTDMVTKCPVCKTGHLVEGRGSTDGTDDPRVVIAVDSGRVVHPL